MSIPKKSGNLLNAPRNCCFERVLRKSELSHQQHESSTELSCSYNLAGVKKNIYELLKNSDWFIAKMQQIYVDDSE